MDWEDDIELDDDGLPIEDEDELLGDSDYDDDLDDYGLSEDPSKYDDGDYEFVE